VTLEADGYQGKARLLDLSPASCRILSDHTLGRGAEVRLQLPAALDPSSDSALTAVVLRSKRATSSHGRRMLQMILEFVPSAEQRTRLERVLSSQAPKLGTLNEPERAELEVRELDRRFGASRYRYARRVEALTYFDSDAPRLLQGQEISARGMRIQPTPDLCVGDPVSLALYRGPGLRPLELHAEVERDDDKHGLWLRFEDMRGQDRQELECLLAGLPAVEAIALSVGSRTGPMWMATLHAQRVQHSDPPTVPIPRRG